MSIKKIVILVIVLKSLISCMSWSVADKNRPYVHLTDNARFFLLPPQEIERPLDMAQHISASYNGQDFFFIAWVKADNSKLEMTLFNELGASIGELYYRDGHIRLSSAVLPRQIKPEYIIADFQLCFYNPKLLQEELEKNGLTLEADETVRRVISSGAVIIEIEKEQDSVRFTNNLRGYSYTLTGDFS